MSANGTEDADGILGLGVITASEGYRLAAVGIGIPAALRIAGLVKGDVTACFVSAALLLGLAAAFEAVGEDGEDAAGYAQVSAKLMTLTFLAELANALTGRFFRGQGEVVEIRTYECMALLLCGFIVLGQLVEVLDVITNGNFDKGVFLGIVVAGLSYSMRDMLSCIIYGFYESAYPAFHVGDRIHIANFEAEVVRKDLASIECVHGGCTVRVPMNTFARGPLRVTKAARAAPVARKLPAKVRV